MNNGKKALKPMNNKTLSKIMLDIIMTILFVTLIFAYDTGLVFHEIAGLSIFALFASHLLLNWRWVKSVTKNLFTRKLNSSSRLKYFLNVIILLIVATIIITGILISQVIFPSLGSSLGNKQLLLVHKWTSYVCLGLFGLHIVLHRRYLVESVRKILTNLRQSKVGKPLLRLGATALIVVVLYSKVLSTSTKHESTQASLYASQIASSSQTTTTLKGKDDSSTNPVYTETTNDDGATISLSDYLGNLHCTACPKHCSLLKPQCGRADPQIKTAKINYQALSAETTS